MHNSFAVALALSIAATQAAAQTPAGGGPPPRGRALNDPELVAVVVTTAEACRNIVPDMRTSLALARLQLRDRARREGTAFRFVGLSITREAPDRGAAGLRSCANFDEVAVPATFFNVPAVSALLSLPAQSNRAPLIVVYRQRRGLLRLLKSVHGWTAIAEWVRTGAPLEG